MLLCLTFSNEKKVEIIFYTKTLNVPKAEVSAFCEMQQKRTRVYAKKKKKRKKSLSSRHTKTRRHINDGVLFAYLF